MFVFGDFNIHHKGRLTYFGGTDRCGELCYNFFISYDLTASASEFCEWVQVGIDVCILHPKYQVKPHSSPRFSAACAGAIVHRNHFFHLYQQNKSSE